MADQKEMNRQTWAALQAAGFHPGSALEVETFSFAPDDSSAAAFADDLTARGWEVQVATGKPKGLFRRKVDWFVVATRQFEAVDLSHLDAMVDELESLASSRGATFDGWGAAVPTSSGA